MKPDSAGIVERGQLLEIIYGWMPFGSDPARAGNMADAISQLYAAHIEAQDAEILRLREVVEGLGPATIERCENVARHWGGTYSRGVGHMFRTGIAEAIASMKNAGPPQDPDGHMYRPNVLVKNLVESLDVMVEHWVQGTHPTDDEGRIATQALMAANAIYLERGGYIASLQKALGPFMREIDRIEKEYGFDRPLHQGQCLMLPLSDLISLRAALKGAKP